jgi:uncharacterized protein (TIGR03437 family)
VAVDATGNLYIADTGNQSVRKVTPDGTTTTVAGNGQLNGPEGVAVDAAGNLYIADTFNGRIRRLAPDGSLITVAGTGSTGVYSGDNNPAVNAAISLPLDVAVDRFGTLYIADFGNSRVRAVSNGIITTVAGNTNGAPAVDGGLAINVRLAGPTGVTVDRNGNVYFVEAGIGSGTGLARGDFRVWKVTTAGIFTAAAGNGLVSYSGDGGAAASAQLNGAAAVAVDAGGNVYIADTGNHRVRRVAASGGIATIAGTGTPGFAVENGPPAAAQLNAPQGLVVDALGRVFIADTSNSRVRRADPGGNIITVAGNGNAAYFGDGTPANRASVNMPEGLALDAAGNLYIADTLDSVVRKMDPAGTITTIAGFGTPGFSGDGGPATSAALNRPRAVAIDANGNVYVADTGNDRVRKIDPLGVITTVADSLSGPRGVAVDRAGNVFIADTGHNRVARILAGGVVAPIAGTGVCCYAGDGGVATSALLNAPWGLAVDAAGNVYVADAGNSAVRVLQPISSAVAVSAAVNAASNLVGAVAPGEVVAIYGAGFGPGTSILFNGTPGVLLYSTATQAGAVVPYGVSGAAVQVVAQTATGASAPLAVPLAATVPAVFTADSSGKGQAAAVNQDGSVNSASNPAPAGSVIALYATGEGQTSPPGVDGKIGAAPLPRPLAQVAVLLGGVAAEVQYAGGAPGVVAGVMQVNAVLPLGLSGNVPVLLIVGGTQSQSGVTVAVR